MALVSVAVVGIGGAAGAVCRYGVSELLERRAIDTLFVNVFGSFLFGVVLGMPIDGTAILAIGVGFCGAFTTFSSFAVGTVQLAEDGERALAALNAVGTLVLALGAIVVGIEVGSFVG